MRALHSLVAVVGLGVASAALAPSAQAHDWSVSVGIGWPGVVVVSPPPAYVPPPRYYAPRPVYVPGYYESGYYAPPPPRYYRAPVVVYGHEYCRERGWRHHHHGDYR